MIVLSFEMPVLTISFAHGGDCETDMRVEWSHEFRSHLIDHPVCAWEVVRCLLVIMAVLAENPTKLEKSPAVTPPAEREKHNGS